MELNEIKKLLYKQNPKAQFVNARKDGLLYEAFIFEEHNDIWADYEEKREVEIVSFLIPLNEIGEVIWKSEMEAKFLIRYLQSYIGV
jgi:hypothetical protein